MRQKKNLNARVQTTFLLRGFGRRQKFQNVITARNGVTVWIIAATRVKSVARCRWWMSESLNAGQRFFLFFCCCEARRSSLCVLACAGAEVVLVLCAGPGPSDTASTTVKPWEASSPRSETSTWSTTSGVRRKMTECAAMRMIGPGRLQFRVFRLAGGKLSSVPLERHGWHRHAEKTCWITW